MEMLKSLKWDFMENYSKLRSPEIWPRYRSQHMVKQYEKLKLCLLKLKKNRKRNYLPVPSLPFEKITNTQTNNNNNTWKKIKSWRRQGNSYTTNGTLYNLPPPGSLTSGNQEATESHKINIECISCQILWYCTDVLHHTSSIIYLYLIGEFR